MMRLLLIALGRESCSVTRRTLRYYLPVVDLNNSLTVRPDNEQLIRSAKALSL